MAADIQDVTFAIKAVDGASAVFKTVGGAMGQLEKSFSSLTRLFGGAVLAGMFTAMVREAKEAEDQSNRLNVVLRATGNAAGLTKQQLDAMADAMAEATQFEDEAIRSGMATFLKFGNIQKGVFEEGIKLAADYAAFLGTDFASGAQAIGRALQSPTMGLRALQQELGRLTPEQERSIQRFMEQGRVMEAQAVVLDFLRGKIKGAAAEMNTGFTGALSAVAKSMGELMESIGKSFVGDAAKSFMTFLTQSMKDLKNIIDNGNWVEKLRNITLFMWGFRGMDSTPPGNRLSTGRIGGLPEGPKDKTAEQIKKESEVAAAALKERNDLLAIGKANDEKYWEARVANAEQYSEQVNMLARKEIEERKKIEEQNQKGNEEAWTRQWDERVEREAAAGQAFLDQLEKEKKAADQWGKEVGLVFVSAFEDAIVAGKSFRDVLQGIEKDIIRLIVRQQVTQPLGRAFNDAIGSPLGGFFGGLFGGKQSPAPVVDMSFAEGTDYVPRTGLALVHQGEKIIPAAQNNGGGGANITQYINIDSRSDRASILQAMTVAKNAAVAEINNSLRSGGSTAMAAGLV